jgi:hypothetical protein
VSVVSFTGCNSNARNITNGVLEESVEITATPSKQQTTPMPSPEVTSEALPEITQEISPEAVPKVTPEITPKVTLEVTPKLTPEVSPEALPVITPEVSPAEASGTSKGTTETTPNNPSEATPTVSPVEAVDEGIPYRAYTILPRDNETAEFNHFYYMDNQNCLNTFFWKYNTDGRLKYTSCLLYKEQKDGSIKDTEITWDNEADKIINLVNEDDNMFSIMSQWTDENTGDFYMIVCKWTFDAEDNPTYLYGIHPNGKLFVNIQVEDCLVMDKIDSSIYACGYTINYLAQKNGLAYFQYKDNSQNAVVYYDMKEDCFIRQIFTEFAVKGVIDDQYVGINEKQLILGSIPEDKELEEAAGNSILTGNSEILQKYEIPDYKGICVSGKYVYLLTKNNYQRIIPGEDDWELLADVSQVTNGSMVSDEIGGDLYLDDLVAKNEHTFSILWYADSGNGYFFDIYCVE